MTADDPSLRYAAAHAALVTAAVTGTNGKTTTTSMIAAIVAAHGEVDACITTLSASVAGEAIEGDEPGRRFLLATERAAGAGVRTLALEVTSKALASGFAERWPPRVAVFTNLSRDHLDMHGSPEAYLAAKARLFLALSHGVPPGAAQAAQGGIERGGGDSAAVAVLNGDDPAGALIAEVLDPGIVVRRFSLLDPGADLAATEVEVTARGTRLSLAPSPLADALGGHLALRVVGRVHAANALAAALAADALGYSAEAIRAGLAAFPGVPGRFELVAERPRVVIDYAHTPGGLEGTLATAREIAGGGRVLCVFGCGGGRDRGKRPLMGQVADRLADVVYLTSDNPRQEAPESIAREVRAGVPAPRATWEELPDRREAIEAAIAAAGPEDVVVIAGKGHETVQEVGGHRLPFSDRSVALAAARRI